MGGIGWKEIVIIALILVVLFGAKRLPELARSFRKSIDEFKKGSDEDDTTRDRDTTDAGRANSSANSAKSAKTDTAAKN